MHAHARTCTHAPGAGDSGSKIDRFAVNLGANDGATSDPVAGLFHAGWSGVAVELEARHAERIHQNLGATKATLFCPQAATPDNIVPMLHDQPTNADFDYLKIDIDSYDCDVLGAILAAGYRPKVIQMETGTIPPPISFAAHYTDGSDGGEYTRPHAQIFQAFGCSLTYVEEMLTSLPTSTALPEGHPANGAGYGLLQAGLDSIWIRRDVIASSGTLKAMARGNEDPLTAYTNGFWRWPWRRELHVWEIGEWVG